MSSESEIFERFIQEIRSLRNEVDCRLDHGVRTEDARGHLEFVQLRLEGAMAVLQVQPERRCGDCLNSMSIADWDAVKCSRFGVLMWRHESTRGALLEEIGEDDCFEADAPRGDR
jgi:hypothetical protein